MADTEREQPESIEELGGPAWVHRDDLKFTFVRSSGPGGQAVNKVSTAAQLRVPLAAIRGLDEAAVERLRRLAGRRLAETNEILFSSRRERSQIANRRACVERLRELVTAAVAPPRVRRKTKPGRGAIRRRLDDKKEQADRKERRRWEGGRNE